MNFFFRKEKAANFECTTRCSGQVHFIQLVPFFKFSYIQIFFSTFHVFCALCRRLWRGPLHDPAGVDARAANVRGRGVDALHPRGSQLGPADGHGDGSVRVAHGQRQPAHLAIDWPASSQHHCGIVERFGSRSRIEQCQRGRNPEELQP